MAEHAAIEFVDGITLDLADDTMVTDVVLVAKTVRMSDGTVGLYLAQSAGVSWIEKIGMLRAAERIESSDLSNDDD